MLPHSRHASSSTTLLALLVALTMRHDTCMLRGVHAEELGAPCSAVLNAGVYNTYQRTSASSSYTSFQQVACQDYSTYTYEQYTQDTSNPASGAVGRAGGFGAALAGLGWSRPSVAAQMFPSKEDFSQAKAQQQAYRLASCTTSSSVAQLQDQMSVMQQTLEPKVYDAYQSCISLYSSGVRVWQTSGFSSTNLALNVKFVQGQPSAVAEFTGLSIFPEGAASCVMQGPANMSKEALQAFKFQLQPTVTYTITCKLSKSAKADGRYTDIYISNSVSGAFHTGLYNKLPASQLDALRAQLLAQQQQQQQPSAATLQALQALQAQVASLQASLAAIQQAQVTQAQGVVVEPGGDVRIPTIGARLSFGNCSLGHMQPGCFSMGCELGRDGCSVFTLRMPNNGRYAFYLDGSFNWSPV